MITRKTDEVCLVCPIHPPDYLYGQMLAYQILRTNINLCFVFTSEEDQQTFLQLTSKKNAPWFKSLVLEEHFTSEVIKCIHTKRLFPIFKKLFALDQLSKDYAWLICVDAETLLLRFDHWAASCESLFASKVWFGGIIKSHMAGELQIATASGRELVPVSDQKQIRTLASNFNFYSWWWDLPAFQSAHVKDFLSWINWKDTSSIIQRASWFTFEHVLYQYFTALNFGFKLQTIQEVTHSLEFSDVSVYKLVADTLRTPTWMNCNAYLQDPDFAIDRGIMAVYHLDRTEFPKFEVPLPVSQAPKVLPSPLYKRVARRVLRSLRR